MTFLQKKRRAEKQLFAKAQKGKRKPAKGKAPQIKKDAYSMLRGVVAEGGMKST
jgi:hypothetical protein